ncbi:MAG: hypothetical protein V7L29_09360 [Nostoc sp.]|uniref:hypothetical protein n=1 Tax=Nostoc sp. TaxID=1180 RepID=UPI002FF63F9C
MSTKWQEAFVEAIASVRCVSLNKGLLLDKSGFYPTLTLPVSIGEGTGFFLFPPNTSGSHCVGEAGANSGFPDLKQLPSALPT